MSTHDPGDSLPKPFGHLPGNRPQFFIYQLRDELEESNNIHHFNQVAIANVDNPSQAAISSRLESWTENPDVVPLVDTSGKPLRPCDGRDLIAYTIEDGSLFYAQIVVNEDGSTSLKPAQVVDEIAQQPDIPAPSEDLKETPEDLTPKEDSKEKQSIKKKKKFKP